MRDLISDFIDFKKSQNKSIHTIKNYESQLKIYKKGSEKVVGNKGKTNRFILNTEKYLLELRRETEKGNTFKTRSMIVKSFFHWMEIEEQLPVPSIDFAKITRNVTMNKEEKKIMSDKEERSFKKYIKNEKLPYKLIFLLALARGLRRSEILSIRHEDLKRNENRCFAYVKRKGSKDRTAIEIEKSLFKEIEKYSIQTVRRDRVQETLFKVHPNYLTDYSKKVTEKAIGRTLSMHEFRHTAINSFIIMCAKQGMSKIEALHHACQFAGHSDLKITQSNYFNSEINSMFEEIRPNPMLDKFNQYKS